MPKTIMIVDDEPDILKVVIFRVKKAGYIVVSVKNGQEALDAIRGGLKPDLILLDLIMPVMDGYEFCRIIKSGAATKEIPVIIVSASASSDIKEKMREMKADAYLIKPYEPQELLARISGMIG